MLLFFNLSWKTFEGNFQQIFDHGPKNCIFLENLRNVEKFENVKIG